MVDPAEDSHGVDLALPIHIDVHARPSAWPWAVAQRLIALVACVVLSPLFLLLYAAVRLSSPGPFLFIQRRPGYRMRPFRMLKIRTMTVGAERQTALGTSKRSPHITSIGRLLRDLKLDELPQLWNVVRGDLELVGPRPLPEPLHEELLGHIPNFDLRYQVKPGLTNVSQVAVLDNKLDSRLVDDWKLRFEGELHYIKNKSFFYDVVVLTMTVLFVVRKIVWPWGRSFERAAERARHHAERRRAHERREAKARG